MGIKDIKHYTWSFSVYSTINAIVLIILFIYVIVSVKIDLGKENRTIKGYAWTYIIFTFVNIIALNTFIAYSVAKAVSTAKE